MSSGRAIGWVVVVLVELPSVIFSSTCCLDVLMVGGGLQCSLPAPSSLCMGLSMSQSMREPVN